MKRVTGIVLAAMMAVTTVSAQRPQGNAAILIRIDTKSGHGASSLTKALETTGDIYSFIMFNMGLKMTPSTLH